MPTFDTRRFVAGAVDGLLIGAFTGAQGAAKTGSPMVKSAAVLGAGMGLFVGAVHGSGLAAPFENRQSLESLATGMAWTELLGGLAGYAGYFLLDTASSRLAVSEFALSMLAGYPLSVGILYCIQVYKDYIDAKKVIEQNADTMRTLEARC